MDKKFIIMARARFAQNYCIRNGWPLDVSELSIKQIAEIRDQDGWKNPDLNFPIIERRSFPVHEIRVQRNGDEPPVIEGHSAVFNKLSENLGGFREKIVPGAFAGALKKSDARALFNHSSNYVLGRESAKTLELTEDKEGLFMRNHPPDTQFARDLLVSIDRGDIKEQSFGFYVGSDKWENLDNDKETIRTILEVSELVDVSIVTFPAYPDTTAAVRSMEMAMDNLNLNRSVETGGDEPCGDDEATLIELRERELKLKSNY